MASKIFTRGQLEKVCNGNIISSFLALQENILVYDLLKQNEEISQQLLHITFTFVLLVKQNGKLFSEAAILKNMSEV